MDICLGFKNRNEAIELAIPGNEKAHFPLPFRLFPLFLQQIHTGRTDDYDNEGRITTALEEH